MKPTIKQFQKEIQKPVLTEWKQVDKKIESKSWLYSILRDLQAIFKTPVILGNANGILSTRVHFLAERSFKSSQIVAGNSFPVQQHSLQRLCAVCVYS